MAVGILELMMMMMMMIIARKSSLTAECYFPQYVHPDKAIRDASIQANKLIDQHDIASVMRADVYARVKHVFQKTPKQQLTAEQQRLLEKMELEYRRNGLALSHQSPVQLEHLKKLKTRLSDVCTDFQRLVNEDTTSLELTRAELEGMPADFFERLKPHPTKADTFIVTMKYPDLFPVLKYAKREDTRRRMDIANSSRCASNIQLMEEALSLRGEIASILGYDTHAAFVMEIRMAKKPETALTFLKDLEVNLKPMAEKELVKLVELKNADLTKRGEKSDGQLNSWDFRFYHQQLLETEYKVDEDAIKEYFSIDRVTKGMLDLYQTVLSLKFDKVSVSVKDATVWHDDVELYRVSDSKTGDLVGHFYLDLYPRDGKYGHAACFGLQPGYVKEDGMRQYPVAAMVANFTKPTKDKPSLLKHDEVVTYFHELGHVMHQMCAQTTFSRFHGTKVERDFVEAPSQMLENWCWEVDILKRLSGKVGKDGQLERIPTDLVEQLVRAKNVNVALMTLRQIFFATFDLSVHTRRKSSSDKFDLNETYRQMRAEISLIPNPENTCPAATFSHLMGGYDSGYYGYLWSQVFSTDMYMSKFKNEGIENVETGLAYRNKVLKQGGSVDGMDMLKDFLGREPKPDAFFESIGLSKL